MADREFSPSLFDAFVLAQSVVLNILNDDGISDKVGAIKRELGKLQGYVGDLVAGLPLAKRAEVARQFEESLATVQPQVAVSKGAETSNEGEEIDMTAKELQETIQGSLASAFKPLHDEVKALGDRIVKLESGDTDAKAKAEAEAKAQEEAAAKAKADEEAAKAKADAEAAKEAERKTLVESISGVLEKAATDIRNALKADLEAIEHRIEKIEKTTGVRQGVSTTSHEDEMAEHARKNGGTKVTKAVAACHSEKDQITGLFKHAQSRAA
jgi:colicin import membrane protein